jgi:hypothetical protein
MHTPRHCQFLVFGFISPLAVACGGDQAAGPADGAVDDLALAAAVVEIADGRMVSVQAFLTNNTSGDIAVSYPAGCPVRIRLYRQGDDALVYDEAGFPCSFAVTATLTLSPGQTRTLTSGGRFPWTVSGDSIPVGPYRATGIVRIIGENPVELEAGTYHLRVVSPPMGRAERSSTPGSR